MSKAEAGMKLVRWLPELVEATADDIARFGPHAARVRGLLDFLPTMSDEASRVAENAVALRGELSSTMEADSLINTLGRKNLREELANSVWASRPLLGPAATKAGRAEILSDVLRPSTYASLTNPLAAGRAVDLLRARPRYQGTPFLDIVGQAAERGWIAGPRDVAVVGRVAQVPDKVAQQEVLDLILNYGMSPEEAIIAVRALG